MLKNKKNLDLNEDTGYRSRVILGKPKKPKIIKVLINRGIVSNEKQGFSLLISFILIAFTVSGFLFYKNFQPNLIQVNLFTETTQLLSKEVKINKYEL